MKKGNNYWGLNKVFEFNKKEDSDEPINKEDKNDNKTPAIKITAYKSTQKHEQIKKMKKYDVASKLKNELLGIYLDKYVGLSDA